MEGAANLTLSALLIKPFGIYGVAIGTLIPSLFFQLIVFPNYLSELLHVSAMRAITRAWGPVFLAAVPFGLASWMLREYPAAHLLGFFAQTAAILPLFFIALALIFHRKVTSDILPLVSSQLNKRLRGQIS
jgi:O-antigen/teichoic acid export membrane protein